MHPIRGKASFHKAFSKSGRLDGQTPQGSRFDSPFGLSRALEGGWSGSPSPAGHPNRRSSPPLLRMAPIYSDFRCPIFHGQQAGIRKGHDPKSEVLRASRAVPDGDEDRVPDAAIRPKKARSVTVVRIHLPKEMGRESRAGRSPLLDVDFPQVGWGLEVWSEPGRGFSARIEVPLLIRP